MEIKDWTIGVDIVDGELTITGIARADFWRKTWESISPRGWVLAPNYRASDELEAYKLAQLDIGSGDIEFGGYEDGSTDEKFFTTLAQWKEILG